MKTVREVSRLTGISVRTLHYYDEIGLLCPDRVTEAGYRLYGTKALERLHQTLNKETLESYKSEARKSWGGTDAFREYEQKAKTYTEEDWKVMNTKFMANFAEFGRLINEDPASEPVMHQVELLKQSITDQYYTCTDDILASLGEMYVCDDRMKESIDRAGGEGTARFVSKAIHIYCQTL